jgi:hypothetical protein
MTTLATTDYAVAETAVKRAALSVAELIFRCPKAIRTPEDREAGSSARRAIREREKAIEDERKAIVGPINDGVKRINDLFRGPLEALRTADDAQKTLALGYDQERERIRLDEQRRLQAIADETARKERERLEKKAETIKTPERREAILEEAAAIVAPVVTVAAEEKPKGESTRKLWRARLTDKAALIQAAAQGNEIAATCLTFDQKAANTMATGTKGAVPCPGIKWYDVDSLAMRGE